jgi:cytochrome c oxidase assembly protein Cox11
VLKGFHVVSFKRVLCVNYDNEMPVHMQVFFYIDPEFVSDPKMNDVNNLILSYTFFKVEEDNEEEVVSQDRS